METQVEETETRVEEIATRIEKKKTVSKGLKWPIILGILGIHIGLLWAPSTFTWEALWVCVALSFITGLLGITACFHRLLAHRSFAVPKWLEYVLTLCCSVDRVTPVTCASVS